MLKTSYLILLCNVSKNLKLYDELCKKNIYYLSNKRNIFGRNVQFGNKKKVYNERKLVGFSMDQMFSVVSDVENYNKFVPFCKKSQLSMKTPERLKAELIIGFPPIVESYTSSVTLVRPKLVKAICYDGVLFNHLNTTWKFSPALKNNLQSCIIDFHISFEFKSLLHSNLAHLFFDVLVRQMEVAFITEAKVRFGKESLPSQTLEIIKSRS